MIITTVLYSILWLLLVSCTIFLFSLELTIFKIYIFYILIINSASKLCLNLLPRGDSFSLLTLSWSLTACINLDWFLFACFRAVIFGFLHHCPGGFLCLTLGLELGLLDLTASSIICYFVLVAHIL